MERLKTAYNNVDGKKTYFVAVVTLVYAVLGLYLGKIEFSEFVNYLLAAGAIFGFRSALNK